MRSWTWKYYTRLLTEHSSIRKTRWIFKFRANVVSNPNNFPSIQKKKKKKLYCIITFDNYYNRSFNEDGNYNINNTRRHNSQQHNTPRVPYHNKPQNPNTQTSRKPFVPNGATHRSFPHFSVSTTKSPYDFQHFTQKESTQHVYTTSTVKTVVTVTSSTINPYIGTYYQLRRRTTKSPYDFADFGKHFKGSSVENDENVNKNYLKRSYASDNFFESSSNSENTTKIVVG